VPINLHMTQGVGVTEWVWRNLITILIDVMARDAAVNSVAMSDALVGRLTIGDALVGRITTAETASGVTINDALTGRVTTSDVSRA
jgi:hypothetical protein